MNRYKYISEPRPPLPWPAVGREFKSHPLEDGTNHKAVFKVVAIHHNTVVHIADNRPGEEFATEIDRFLTRYEPI